MKSGEAESWPATPGPADYPATFRYEGRMLAFILLEGLVLIGTGVLCAWVPAIIGSPVMASDQAVYWGLGLIVAAIGAFLIAGGLTSTLVLQEDAIEDRSKCLDVNNPGRRAASLAADPCRQNCEHSCMVGVVDSL